MSRIRVGLLGAGAMGTIMARDIYPRLGEVEVVAVVDQQPQRCEQVAASLGARHFSSLAEAVRSTGIDAVDIRLPHSAHAAATLEALDLGLHVLVEKPLATSLAECEAMIAAEASAGRVVAVAENYPHLASVRATAAAMASGRVGEVLGLRSTRAFRLEGVWATTWRQGPGQTAGILWDQGTHHTSLLRCLGGEVAWVSATAATGLVDQTAESVAVTLGFRSGLVAQSLYCWGTPAVPLETEGTVYGSAGRIDIMVDYDGDDGTAVLRESSIDSVISDREGYYDSHRLIVLDWIGAITTGARPRVGLDWATADVRVVLAARESVQHGGIPVPVGST